MIERFQPEKYYRFMGHSPEFLWSSSMFVVLDHEPRKCIGIGMLPDKAVLENVGRDYAYEWGDLSKWELYASSEIECLNKRVDDAILAVDIYYRQHPEEDPVRRKQ